MSKSWFENVIKAGNAKDATDKEREAARRRTLELQALIAPYFLRREKSDVLVSNGDTKGDVAISDDNDVAAGRRPEPVQGPRCQVEPERQLPAVHGD